MPPSSPFALVLSNAIRLFLVSILLFAFVTELKAQDTVTGAFEGIVSDSQTGLPLKGAAVEMVNQQTGLTFNVRTDYRGSSSGIVITGIYLVRVSMPGYATKSVPQRLRITYTAKNTETHRP